MAANGFDVLLHRSQRMADALRATHQPHAAGAPAAGNQHREASTVQPTNFPRSMPLWLQARAADERQEAEQARGGQQSTTGVAAQPEQGDRAQAEAQVLDHLRTQLGADIEAEVQRRVQARLQPTARAWIDGSTWSPQPETQPPEPRQLNDHEHAGATTSPEPASDPAPADRVDSEPEGA